MNNNQIDMGDYVIVKDPFSSKLRMTVVDVNEHSAECSYFVGSESVHKIEWFPFTDLELVQKADGGFVD